MRRRVFLATVDSRLIALDAQRQTCQDFGQRTVDLQHDLLHQPDLSRRVPK